MPIVQQYPGASWAAAVAQILLEQGLPQAALDTRGTAEDDPVAANSSAAGRSRNRRVEIFLSNHPLSDVADKSRGTLPSAFPAVLPGTPGLRR